MDALRQILSADFPLKNALYSVLLTGLFAPLIGVYLVVGRHTLLALALPQISSVGVALAVAVCSWLGLNAGMYDNSGRFFTLAAAGAGSAMAFALFWQAYTRTRVRTVEDAETGAQYAVAFALTLAIAASNLVRELGLLGVLQGDPLAVNSSLLIVQALTFAAVAAAVALLWHPFYFVLFDARLAYCAGLPAQRLSALLTALICILIGAGGLCAGPIGIFAFMVLPVLSVYPFTHSLRTLALLSSAAGAACAFIGFYLSYALDNWNLPIIAAQVIVLGMVWIGSRVVAMVLYRSEPA